MTQLGTTTSNCGPTQSCLSQNFSACQSICRVKGLAPTDGEATETIASLRRAKREEMQGRGRGRDNKTKTKGEEPMGPYASLVFSLPVSSRDPGSGQLSNITSGAYNGPNPIVYGLARTETAEQLQRACQAQETGDAANKGAQQYISSCCRDAKIKIWGPSEVNGFKRASSGLTGHILPHLQPQHVYFPIT